MQRILVLLILTSIAQAATAGKNMHNRIAKIQSMQSDSLPVYRGVINKQHQRAVKTHRHAKHHPISRSINYRSEKREVVTLVGVTQKEVGKATFRHRSKRSRRHFKNI